VALGDEGNTEVGADAAFWYQKTLVASRIPLGIVDLQSLPSRDDALAKGVNLGHVSTAGPRLWKAVAALEEKPIGIHERDHCGRRRKDLGRQTRKTIESRMALRIQDRQVSEGSETIRV
jgi:hypothetical protein